MIKKTSKRQSIDNVQDATIAGVNVDGTYDLRLRSGAIKKNAINLRSDLTYNIGDVVNISMVSGTKETAKIIGKSTRRQKGQVIVYV
jgi:hypothetical protein